uniref:Uncharacterized protein n=1 Tax=Apteryx owenii TaxID=8824 RepID=A0A8B9PM01_APTOW
QGGRMPGAKTFPCPGCRMRFSSGPLLHKHVERFCIGTLAASGEVPGKAAMPADASVAWSQAGNGNGNGNGNRAAGAARGWDLRRPGAPVAGGEASALRLAYVQGGGREPAVLAQLLELQVEAAALEQQDPLAAGVGALGTELLAVELENRRLEDELLRLKVRRERRADAGRCPLPQGARPQAATEGCHGAAGSPRPRHPCRPPQAPWQPTMPAWGAHALLRPGTDAGRRFRHRRKPLWPSRHPQGAEQPIVRPSAPLQAEPHPHVATARDADTRPMLEVDPSATVMYQFPLVVSPSPGHARPRIALCSPASPCTPQYRPVLPGIIPRSPASSHDPQHHPMLPGIAPCCRMSHVSLSPSPSLHFPAAPRCLREFSPPASTTSPGRMGPGPPLPFPFHAIFTPVPRRPIGQPWVQAAPQPPAARRPPPASPSPPTWSLRIPLQLGSRWTSLELPEGEPGLSHAPAPLLQAPLRAGRWALLLVSFIRGWKNAIAAGLGPAV